MSSCAAPAGSPCRTARGRVAAQYHTARFRLVPRLAKALAVPVPPLRRPGSAWAELPALRRPTRHRPGTCGSGTLAPRPPASRSTPRWTRCAPRASPILAEDLHPRPHPARARQGRRPRQGDPSVRGLGHDRGARAQAARPRRRAGGARRAVARRRHRPGVPSRGAARLPRPVWRRVHCARRDVGQRARVHPRPHLEGHESARARGKAIGGAAVTDDAMLAAALHLRGQEMSLRDAAARLVIATGKKKASTPHPRP